MFSVGSEAVFPVLSLLGICEWTVNGQCCDSANNNSIYATGWSPYALDEYGGGQ